MEDFKDAWCIELYDPLVYIQGDADASGLAEYGTLPGFTLDGDDLSKFLEFFPQVVVETSTETNLKTNKEYRVALSSRSLPIRRPLKAYLDDYPQMHIDRIQAKIEEGHSLLQIIVDVTSDGETERDYFTYSGRYLVHWAPPSEEK